MKRLSKLLLSAGLILGLASCGDVVLESTNNVTTKPTEVKPTQTTMPTQSETPKSEAYKKVVGLCAMISWAMWALRARAVCSWSGR